MNDDDDDDVVEVDITMDGELGNFVRCVNFIGTKVYSCNCRRIAIITFIDIVIITIIMMLLWLSLIMMMMIMMMFDEIGILL